MSLERQPLISTTGCSSLFGCPERAVVNRNEVRLDLRLRRYERHRERTAVVDRRPGVLIATSCGESSMDWRKIGSRRTAEQRRPQRLAVGVRGRRAARYELLAARSRSCRGSVLHPPVVDRTARLRDLACPSDPRATRSASRSSRAVVPSPCSTRARSRCACRDQSCT